MLFPSPVIEKYVAIDTLCQIISAHTNFLQMALIIKMYSLKFLKAFAIFSLFFFFLSK